MKKLMLTAAVLATGIAVAGVVPCERDTPVPPTPEKGAAVYQLKMPLKTTKGVASLTTVKGSTVGGVCSRTVIPDVDFACVYRTADQINIEGFLAICENGCDSLEKVSDIYLWETRRKVTILKPAIKFDFLHIMGKNFTEAEAFWTITGGNLTYNLKQAQQIKTITCAGLGKFDTNKGLYTSLSGNAVGTISASFDLKPKATLSEDIACAPSKVWTCANLGVSCDDAKAEDTVVYGTWSIKYNASLSKKYYADGAWALPLPKYYIAL